jgi:Methylase of chemotaxis methyl-accepting proteins
VAAQSPGELHSIAEEIALGETSFFREPEQFRALWHLVLPELMEKRAGTKRLRLWSAGCSTGEEPYSLAMILEDLLGEAPDWRIEILAVDLRSKALLHASQGRYTQGSAPNCERTHWAGAFQFGTKGCAVGHTPRSSASASLTAFAPD